jgi:hypothetical protein
MYHPEKIPESVTDCHNLLLCSLVSALPAPLPAISWLLVKVFSFTSMKAIKFRKELFVASR